MGIEPINYNYFKYFSEPTGLKAREKPANGAAQTDRIAPVG